jgi:argininosuccinate lyase
VLKGLPSGYNKDLQNDKRALFDAVDLMGLVLPAVEGALAELTFDEARMHAALSSTMMATDLADYLVKKGSSFRQAHEAVGSLIQEAERRGCELGALGIEMFTAASPLFDPDIFESLDPASSIASRDIPGGTGPNAVRQQLNAARIALTIELV